MKRTIIVFAFGVGLAAMSVWLMGGGGASSREAQEAYQRCDYIAAVRAYQNSAESCHDLPALAGNQAAALYRLERFSDADGRYRIAAGGEDALQSAKAAYCRGNCALKLACCGEGAPNGGFLDQAEEQYRTCLDRDQEVAGSDKVFEDARYNLELIKLLRQPTGSNVQPDASQDLAAGDPQTGIRKASYESRDKSSPSSELLAAKEKSDYLCPD